METPSSTITATSSLQERWEAFEKQLLANASEEFLTAYHLTETGDAQVVSEEELQEIRRKYNIQL